MRPLMCITICSSPPWIPGTGVLAYFGDVVSAGFKPEVRKHVASDVDGASFGIPVDAVRKLMFNRSMQRFCIPA